MTAVSFQDDTEIKHNNHHMNFPDFIIIGAGKSGTTSLNNYLSQHPDIYMSKKKEPNFFAYDTIDINNAPPGVSVPHMRDSVINLDDYQALFAPAAPGQVKGEVSNIYMYSPYALDSLKKYVPDAKFIAILRQPAERIFSRLQHLLHDERAPDKDINNVFDRDSIWWQRGDLVKEGMYAKNLAPFFEAFGRDQIKVYLYDQLREEPRGLLAELFDYLGVRNDVDIDTDMYLNKSGIKKKNAFNYLLGPDGVVIRASRKLVPGLHTRLKENKEILKKLTSFRNKNISRMRLSPELKKRITHEIYLEDIKQLEQLLQRDLSHWYKF